MPNRCYISPRWLLSKGHLELVAFASPSRYSFERSLQAKRLLVWKVTSSEAMAVAIATVHCMGCRRDKQQSECVLVKKAASATQKDLFRCSACNNCRGRLRTIFAEDPELQESYNSISASLSAVKNPNYYYRLLNQKKFWKYLDFYCISKIILIHAYNLFHIGLVTFSPIM